LFRSEYGTTCAPVAWWLDKPTYRLFLSSLAVTALDDGLIQVWSCVLWSKINLFNVFWYQTVFVFNCSCL